uniref:Uncharacterized protein n=2 Tax=Timema TaxID=61471 RepID=A0A7R9HRS4_9NEOP|nr:unnamed protein product [Timema monikensis]
MTCSQHMFTPNPTQHNLNLNVASETMLKPTLNSHQAWANTHSNRKLYSDFELQGVMEDKLNSKTYQTISQRMQTEEATCALTMSSRNDNEDSEDYPDTGLDDDGDRSKPKVTIRETLGEDGNYVAKITNVTTNVVGRVGNMFGKGIGGLTSKFGGGSWF